MKKDVAASQKIDSFAPSEKAALIPVRGTKKKATKLVAFSYFQFFPAS